MGFFKRNLTQTQEEPKQEESEYSYRGYFAEGDNGKNNIVINKYNAMEIPSFAKGLNLIIDSISKCPIKLYKEDGNGKVTRHIQDHRVRLLNEENCYYGNAINYRKNIIRDMLLDGISYSYLDKKGLDINGIHRIEPNTVTIDKKANEKGILTSVKARYTLNETLLDADLEDLLVIPFRSEDGMNGKNIFKDHQKLLSLMYQELGYSENVYKNYGVPMGILQTSGKVAKDVVERLKANWEKLYTGSTNQGKVAVLEGGLEYKPLSQSPTDLNLMESKKNNVREIEKIFNLPTGILDDLNSSDIEMLMGCFRSTTLEPIMELMEQSFNKALLLEDEKEEGYYFKFDRKSLEVVKGLDKINGIATRVKNGVMSVNEARAEDDMNDFEGADMLALSLGNIFIKPDGEVYVPNMQGSTDANKEGSMKNNNIEDNEGTTNE